MRARRPAALRVATLNLWGRFGHWGRRLATLEETWPAVDADVLLVQEVWVTPERDQVREVAERLGYAHEARGLPTSGERGGAEVETVAILSRLPLHSVDVTVLPTSEPLRSRVTATVDHPGASVTVGCGHTVFTPPALCVAQVRALCRVAASPLVLGGDLNARPETALPLVEEQGLLDTLAGAATPTWPVDRDVFRRGWVEQTGSEPTFSLSPRRLDYVLSRGLATVAAGVEPLRHPRSGEPASDHAAVWADLRV